MSEQAIKPIYIIRGGDQFLRDAFRLEIVAHVIQGADAQLCVSTFDAEAELAIVLDELRTLPFLAPRRAVVIHEADAFVAAHRDALEKYFETPSKNSALVLIVDAWPSNTRLAKLTAKIGQVYDADAPKAGALGNFIRQAIAKRGKKITPEAVDLLASWVGADLAALDSEAEKLCVYIGERPGVIMQDVSLLVAATAGPGAFDLTNAIIDGNAKAALVALDGMMTHRGEEFRILALLASHLRKTARAQQLAMEGKRPESALPPNMPPHAKNAFLAMLKRRPITKIHKDFRRLIAADLGMKSGLEPAAAMQELVIEMCQ